MPTNGIHRGFLEERELFQLHPEVQEVKEVQAGQEGQEVYQRIQENVQEGWEGCQEILGNHHVVLEGYVVLGDQRDHGWVWNIVGIDSG